MRTKSPLFVLMVTSFAFTSVAAAQTASEVELWDATWAEYQALDAIPLEERGMVSVSQDSASSSRAISTTSSTSTRTSTTPWACTRSSWA